MGSRRHCGCGCLKTCVGVGVWKDVYWWCCVLIVCVGGARWWCTVVVHVAWRCVQDHPHNKQCPHVFSQTLVYLVCLVELLKLLACLFPSMWVAVCMQGGVCRVHAVYKHGGCCQCRCVVSVQPYVSGCSFKAFARYAALISSIVASGSTPKR